MTGPDDLARQVAAMAAQVERLDRAVTRANHRADAHQADAQAAAARLKQAEDQAAQLQAGLEQAMTQLRAVSSHVQAGQRRPAPPALSWLDPQPGPADGPPGPTPAEILDDLDAWLARVYVRLPGPRLPACWAFHPGVVDVLLALRMAHAEVYNSRGGTWEKAVNWHLRSRPDTAKRISEWIGTCEIRQHGIGGPLHQGKAPEVPLAGFLAEVAAVWGARRETPDPTAPVIAAADRYVRRERDSAA